MSTQIAESAPPVADAEAGSAAAPRPAVDVAPPSGRLSRWWKRLLITGAALLLAGVATGAVLKLTADDEKPATGDRAAVAASDPANAFKVVLPEGWRSATKEELAQAPGTPLAVLRRDDGAGFVVIRRSGRIPEKLGAFTRDLDAQLKRRFEDVQRQSAKVIKVRAGSAYNYLYVRKGEGSVQTITIVPADRGSFTLNGVAKGGDAKVAREVGRVIASFDA